MQFVGLSKNNLFLCFKQYNSYSVWLLGFVGILLKEKL